MTEPAGPGPEPADPTTEALARLAAGLAHDFNNILGAILGNAHLLCEDLDPASLQHGFARNIATAAGRAQDMIGQLLAYSQPSAEPHHRVDLAALVAEAVDQAPAPPGVTLAFTAPTGSPHMTLGASGALRQAVDQALGTAIDAAGTHGRVAVTLTEGTGGSRDTPAQPGRATVTLGSVDPDRATLRLVIEDDGAGMPADQARHMFEPFFAPPGCPDGRQFGGGLGQAMLLGTIRSHGGAIGVETGAGLGTRLEIVLPRQSGALPAPSAMPAPAASAAAGAAFRPAPGTIALVVDDQDDTAAAIAETLERFGYAAVTAGSGGEALEMLAEADGAIGLVLTDQVMAPMAGHELAARLETLYPEIPVVLCTGSRRDLLLRDTPLAGISATVQKPIDPQQLRQTLATLRHR